MPRRCWDSRARQWPRAVITVLVLVFGEILPKSFAKDHAERVSMAMGGPLYIVKTLLAPLVWVFVQIKRLFTGRALQ